MIALVISNSFYMIILPDNNTAVNNLKNTFSSNKMPLSGEKLTSK